MNRYGRWAVVAALGVLLLAPAARGAEKGGGMPAGHGAMPGGGMQGGGMPAGGMQGGMGMGNMGDKIGGGPFGPWKSAIYLSDSRKAIAGARAKGAKVDATITHHLMVMLLSQEGGPVLEGKGSVTVSGPGMSGKKYDLVSMQGQFGADLPLAKAGKYTLKISLKSGSGKGEKTVTATVK